MKILTKAEDSSSLLRNHWRTMMADKKIVTPEEKKLAAEKHVDEQH